jgi:subtilisin family serine protease
MRIEIAIGMIILMVTAGLIVIVQPADGSEDKTAKWGNLAEFSSSPINGEIAEGASALTDDTPWWVDMVDAEAKDVDYTGDDVYVAVLDTGLKDNWDYYFNSDNICTEYGKGFSHDFVWDPVLETFKIGATIGSEWIDWGVTDDRGYLCGDLGSGHGTHVTSTIIGYNAYLPAGDFFIRGVAPDAKIIPVKVIDTWLLDCPDPDFEEEWYSPVRAGKTLTTGCSDYMVAAGIDYITDLAKDELEGEKIIISMSLGFGVEIPIVEEAMKKAWDAGIVIVCSAGNNGYNGMGWPGAYKDAISCAASGWTETYLGGPGYWRNDVPEDLNSEDYWENDWHMMLMPFSSRPNQALKQAESLLDLTCPGYHILGPYQYTVWWNGNKWETHYEYFKRMGRTDEQIPNIYFWLQGTSMSAPHVSGIASIVFECAEDNDADISPDKMETILKNAAKENWVPGSYTSCKYYSNTFTWQRKDWGCGFLQADEAVEIVEQTY